MLSTVRLEPETMFTLVMIIFAFVMCSLFGLVIVSYMHANVSEVSFHMKLDFYVINFCCRILYIMAAKLLFV